MRERRLRALLGAPPADGRIFWTDLWFSVGNARSAALLPRLERLDAYFLRTSDRRVPRGLQYRAYRSAIGAAALRYALARAARLYGRMLATDIRHLSLFPGRVVIDIPDAEFVPAEAVLLERPNVEAYVVTSEHAARRFEALGVTKRWHVIPQGVNLDVFAGPRVREVRERRPRDGEVVVGYAAALLFAPGDPEGEHPLYGLGHLLELWDGIRARVPNARLWLLGRATPRAGRLVEGRPDVTLFGWLPREDALAHIANFDIALYPRQYRSVSALKIAEYLGAGVPIVSYDHEVADPIRDGGGAVARTPEQFVDAVVKLATDEAERRRRAEEARAIGATLGWDALARRYEREILDVYLPP